MFKWLFGSKTRGAKRQTWTAKVLVCALDPKFREEAAADAKIYSSRYRDVLCKIISSLDDFNNELEKSFNVVHMFSDIDKAGIVAGLEISGTALIGRCCDAGVMLLWMASDNNPDGYIAGFNPKGRRISLVMTIKRHGNKFDAFLSRLLEKMSSGKSLPVAWVELAPQSDHAPEQAELPESIYSAGGGQLRLH